MPSVTKATDDSLISCCISRIIHMASEIERTHTMGVPHGEHDEPWTLEFHQVVVGIYLQTIPAQYAKDVAASFKHCATLLANTDYPADEATEWLIVQAYVSSVAESICEYLKLGPTDLATGTEHRLEPTTPGILPYAEIAPLVSPVGVTRLLQASQAVQVFCTGAQSVSRPPEADIELLRMLATEKSIVDIATECECSRMTIHRRLNRICARMGVVGHWEAILAGGRNGWL